MESIKKYIENFVKLSEQDWDIIKMNFEKVNFDTEQVILEEGSICKYLYFQEEGFVRFYITINGNEISRALLPAPCFFASRKSFNHQIPSKEGIHCLEKIVGWRLSYENYQKLFELPSWNAFMIALLNYSHDLLDDYIISLLTSTAEERYLNLVKEAPSEIAQRVPLKHLSTALGITPQSLSRIRSKKINPKSK